MYGCYPSGGGWQARTKGESVDLGKSGSSSRCTRTRTTETRDVKTRRSRSSGGRTRGSETKGLGGARRGWTRSSAAKTWWTRSRRRGWVRHGNPCGNHLQRGGRQGGGDCLEEDGHLPGVFSSRRAASFSRARSSSASARASTRGQKLQAGENSKARG